MTEPGELLKQADIDKRLQRLSGWRKDAESKTIVKEYTFDDFLQAIEFMSSAARRIDELNHHPAWTNEFNRITVSLYTHSKGGITDADFLLASLLDECYAISKSA